MQKIHLLAQSTSSANRPREWAVANLPVPRSNDNTTIGGTSPTSSPVIFATSAATVAPKTPTGLTAQWQVADPSGTTDTIIATWNAALPGNSPVDEYEIVVNGSDGAGTSAQTVSGTTLTAYFNVDFIPNWTVTVRAHNAAGWSPWSTPFTLGGL